MNFIIIMSLYIMVDEAPEVSLSLVNVLNHESQKGTHFTLYHMGGPIDVAL